MLCLRTYQSRLQPRQLLLVMLLVLGLVAAIVVARRVALVGSLYEFNLGPFRLLEAISAPKRGEKILIFAPHEDDETLGCGGYIQQAANAGAHVSIVLMTNGEYPEIDVILFEETLSLRPGEFIRLGYMRQRETLRAVQYLGLPPQVVTFLGYPNQYLNQMWLPSHWLPDSPVRSARTHAAHSLYSNSMTPRAVYCGQSVLRDVETVLLREKPDIVIALHPNDVHVDHWPTYAFVMFALNELAVRGETFARDCRVYTYLIHRDAWPAPRGYHHYLKLEPPRALVQVRQTDWRARPLTEAQTIRKHKAISFYRTQLGAYDPLLQSFARTNELFGLLADKVWSADGAASSSAVITDPEADLGATAADAHADIHLVSLVRKRDRLTASITTRGTVEAATSYHLSIHAGGRDGKDRTIVEYKWDGEQASARVLRKGILGEINPEDLQVTAAHRLTTLEAPWPFSDNTPTFFMVRAWTTRGKRVIDQTAVTTFLNQSPE